MEVIAVKTLTCDMCEGNHHSAIVREYTLKSEDIEGEPMTYLTKDLCSFCRKLVGTFMSKKAVLG